MKLFNKTIDRQLFKQYPFGSDLSKQEVVAKIFNPYGAGTWFILNSDPDDPDYLWAIVDLGYGAEVGSVSRSQLENYRNKMGFGFERDLYFDPINASELFAGLRNGEFYKKGGNLSRDRKFLNHSQKHEILYSKDKPNRRGYGYGNGGEVTFSDYNGCEIMYEPHGKKYYANDVEFDTIEEAKKFIDSGEVSPEIRNAYAKGLFDDGGKINKKKVDEANEIYREHNREIKEKGIENFSKESVALWNEKYDDRLKKLKLTFEERQSLDPRKWYVNGGDVKEYRPSVYYFFDENGNEVTFSELERAIEEAKEQGQQKVRDNLGGEYFLSYEDGGNIENFSDNQRMIMNQNVELEHHHEELEDILENMTPVPAWVVAKMAVVTQNLSDITHYLDGQKELMEEENEDEAKNKEVVEPIYLPANSKNELTKNFINDAWGNLRGFLKGMEGIDLRDDYTFDYKDEQFEIEPIINSDEDSVSNAVFTIFKEDGTEVGEVAYSREGGKQKFTANSEFFSWNNAKFEDGGYFDGTIPNVSSYMSTYANGGEVAKAEILGLSKNIMGTTDIEMKITGMRKSQDFIVYPIGADDSEKVITIQSGTRIGKIDLKTGRGVMSQNHSSGAYFVHLQMDKLTPFTLTESDLEDLKSHIFKTSGSNVGSSVVKSDNSGASRVFNDGGFIDKYEVDRFKQVVNDKVIAKYVVRLKDSFGNNKTYVFGINLKDRFRGCELVPYEVLFGGWSNSGMPFSLSNLQVKKLVPDTYTNIELDEQETEMLVNKLVKNNKVGVEKFLNSQFFFLNYNQTFKDVLKRHFELSVVNVSSIEFEIVEKFAKGGKIHLGDIVEVKEPNYGYDSTYYVVDDEAGYDSKGFLISDTRKRVGDVFEEEQLKKTFADGGFMADVYASGGMVVTSIKDIPDFEERLEQRRVTYRGLGMGKLANDFYKLAGTSGMRIKVDGKEYFITDEEFNSFSRDADGNLRVRFDAPTRRHEDGGFMANGGRTEKIRWQDVERGDSARVREINRMGLITHSYGRKFNLLFPNGTEKTFDASELDFYKLEKDEYKEDNHNNYAKGGSLEDKLTKLKNKKSVLKSKLLDAQLKSNRVMNNIGFGAGMRRSKVSFSTSREDSLKERINVVEKEIEETENALLQKNKKYIPKAEIKSVTVKRDGKEVTYKGADVLNGANVLAKGGDITSKANYIPKRDVIEVELNDGSKVKPVNGYWIKKDSKPIGAEPTPVNSGKSTSKIGQTYIKKDMRGNWKAETTVDDFNDYDWRISTIKTYSGKLISSAQGGKTEATGSKNIQMFKFTMYEDPNYTLEVSVPKRLSEKVVTEQHDKALAKFKKFMETGMFKSGGKISKFDKLSAKVAKEYEGKPVKSEYQEEYGKYYSKEEAQEVGDKVAGKVKAMQSNKKEIGGTVKKNSSAREMLVEANQLAKKIRKDGESWNEAKKRAFAQLKK